MTRRGGKGKRGGEVDKDRREREVLTNIDGVKSD